ncbi:MAG: hypothetical protein HZA51_12245 [Planctomycetes bacterium]|nr:hypothetical protein [Planctomycetota bacterium]
MGGSQVKRRTFIEPVYLHWLIAPLYLGGMAKNETLIMRIDAERKKKLAERSARLGISVTAFVVKAIDQELSITEKKSMQSVQAVFGGVPSFFRACCMTASTGGAGCYAVAAYELTRHLLDLCPHDTDQHEWHDLVNELSQLEKEEEVLEWFDEHMPKCMKLVPKRRRQSFYKGFRQFEDENVPA